MYLYIPRDNSVLAQMPSTLWMYQHRCKDIVCHNTVTVTLYNLNYQQNEMGLTELSNPH